MYKQSMRLEASRAPRSSTGFGAQASLFPLQFNRFRLQDGIPLNFLGSFLP